MPRSLFRVPKLYYDSPHFPPPLLCFFIAAIEIDILQPRADSHLIFDSQAIAHEMHTHLALSISQQPGQGASVVSSPSQIPGSLSPNIAATPSSAKKGQTNRQRRRNGQCRKKITRACDSCKTLVSIIAFRRLLLSLMISQKEDQMLWDRPLRSLCAFTAIMHLQDSLLPGKSTNSFESGTRRMFSPYWQSTPNS
jgi:hypothetical protein